MRAKAKKMKITNLNKQYRIHSENEFLGIRTIMTRHNSLIYSALSFCGFVYSRFLNFSEMGLILQFKVNSDKSRTSQSKTNKQINK